MTLRQLLLLLFLGYMTGTGQADPKSQINLPHVEKMPNMPEPYIMRDWKKVAIDLDTLIFDETLKGDYLPVLKWYKNPDTEDRIFSIPSYLGWAEGNTYEAITCLGAINGASIAGINKTSQGSSNWVELCKLYYGGNRGVNLYLNNPSDATGDTFWYELFPSILFFRIYHSYPETCGMKEQFLNTADLWYQACVGMGGKTEPWTIPDFNHTAYNFKTGKTVDNGIWKEPASSAAIAWIEYAAFGKTENKKYLTAAKWGLDYLEQISVNPFYEILYPHGVYTAARMNAELDTNYDIEKLINWCFDGSSKRRWGQSFGKWGDLDCSGLVGSVRPSEDNGYMFAMNTFNMAGSLVPLARYDDRFARAIGKWMLNAANSARLFYPAYLPCDQQTDADWAKQYDPTSCIAYEGLRKTQTKINRISTDFKSINGKLKSGSFKQTIGTDKRYQIIEESSAENGPTLEYIWKIHLEPEAEHQLNMVAKCLGPETFKVSYATTPKGPYTKLFAFDSQKDLHKSSPIKFQGDCIYLKAKDSGINQQDSSTSAFYIDDVWIKSTMSQRSPYGTGDAKENGWAKTNLGLYGSVYAGIFGGIIERTNVEGILKLDCLATDYFHAKAYPTFLYYNPYPETKSIQINLGAENKKLYDTISNKIILENSKNLSSFRIDPDSARIIVIVPEKSVLIQKNGEIIADNVIIDFSN